MTPEERHVHHALDALTHAFAERNAEMVLDLCTQDVTYIGSEEGEQATGRIDVSRLLTLVFDRAEAYAFAWTQPVIGICGNIAWLHVSGTGTVVTDPHSPTEDTGTAESFGYRLSGVLRRHDSPHWQWVLIHGSEPTPPPGTTP